MVKTPFFRRLEEGDAAAMASLETRCFSLPWTEQQCQCALRQKIFAAGGLWVDETLVAYCSCYHIVPELEILNLAVAPELRRHGHGERILRLLLQTGCKMGMQKAVLEVRESNLAAIALYEKTGFKLNGRRLKYYSDNGENALIYARSL